MERRRPKVGAPAAILAGLAAFALAACGEDERKPKPPPSFPSKVAASLSARSSEVAELIEADDNCGARDEATQLRDSAERMIADDRVDPELRDHLLSGIDALVGRIRCVETVEVEVPVPVEPPPEPQEEKPEEKPEEPKPPEGGGESGEGSGDEGSGGEGSPPPGQDKKDGEG